MLVRELIIYTTHYHNPYFFRIYAFLNFSDAIIHDALYELRSTLLQETIVCMTERHDRDIAQILRHFKFSRGKNEQISLTCSKGLEGRELNKPVWILNILNAWSEARVFWPGTLGRCF